MGKYVYLRDEEIKRLNEDLEIFNSLTDDEIDKSIKDKLSQKPKTLEDFYFEIKDSGNKEWVRYQAIETIGDLDGLNIVFDKLNKSVHTDFNVRFCELEAILNKARELFKEKDNVQILCNRPNRR